MKKYKVVVGITMGDPAGIGPAVITKAIAKVRGLADFTVIGDKWVFGQLPVTNARWQAAECIDLKNVCHKHFKFGKMSPEHGRASVEYLDKAIEMLGKKQIHCLVTCPVSKEAVNLAGFAGFSGHTEYLARQTNTKHFAMMLLNGRLRFSLVTRHIPLKDVPRRLDADEIYRTSVLTHRALKELFLIRNPSIAVCGLNPHASDNGILGGEENRIIKPALMRLLRVIRNINGPLPADVAVLKMMQGKYDCLIAMYHDQALIPLKMMDAYRGVNLTLGLPFIRTSPLHGTAFDIAAKFDLACPDSLIEAIRLAVRCALNQKKD